jgi:tRNA-(ms[2]io[6]A)-hydroxylase
MVMNLKTKTPAQWLETVQSDFSLFLTDHAACERKASATGINFVVQYPDRTELLDPMIRFAREELLHFQQVCRLLQQRGLTTRADERNPYVNRLLANIRHGRDERFLDRLLTFGIIEARGAERFSILGEQLENIEMKNFYQQLADAEKRHQELFIEMARIYFSADQVEHRLEELLDREAEIVSSLPLRASVH